MRFPQLTNATKANVIAVLNAALGLVVAFGVHVTTNQLGAVSGVVNAVLVAWVAATYQQSPKRMPDPPSSASVPQA